MSFVDNVEYVQHVEDDTPRLLVLKNDFRQAIKTFSLLNLKLLDNIVSLEVFLTVNPKCVCVGVGWQGFFEDGIITPVFEDVNDIVILVNGLDRLVCLQILWKKGWGDGHAIRIDAECRS